MTKRRSTKSALISAALILAMTFTSFVGTTFAWFTDSVTSANNIIKSGNLDVEMYYADGSKAVPQEDSSDWSDASKGAIFNYSLWEPGFVQVRHIRIANEGSLALKYQLKIQATGEVSKLAEVIDVYYIDPAVQVSSRTELTDAYKIGTLNDVLNNLENTGSGTLVPAGEEGNGFRSSETLTIALKMRETADNNYEDISIGSAFSVVLLATQVSYENDSFDDQYDNDAPISYVVNNVAELKNALANAIDGDVIAFGADMSDSDGVLLTDKNVTIDLGGHTFTVSEGASTNNRVFKINGNSNVTIKNGTLVAQGDMTSGAYGTIRTEGSANVTLSNVQLYNYRGYGLNVKANTGTTVTINDSYIYSQYGGGVEAAGGTVEFNNVIIEQEGVYSDAAWCSVAIGVNGGGKAIINSGTYSASTIPTDANAAQGTWVAYVMSSGGDLIINGGTFNGNVAETANAANACGVICADRAAVVEINNGTFNSNGAILDMRNNAGTLPNPVATLNGGVFSADPRVSGLYSSNLIKLGEGYKVVENADGTWTISEMDIYEKGEYEFTDTPAVEDVASALDFNKSVAVRLPAGETSTPSIALDFTGSTDNNFAIVGNDTVFTGDLQISSHPNFHLGDNAELIIDGITVNGTLKVVAYYKNIVIRNVKAQSIEVNDGGNVTIENCVVDGSSDNGIYVVATANGYNLTLKGNTVKNCAKNAVQISGCASGATYGAGKVVVTGNTFENWCTKNDKPRAAFKVWGDSVLAPSSISDASQMTDAATSLVNAIKNGNNNFISDSSNANQVQYDFYDCIL